MLVENSAPLTGFDRVKDSLAFNSGRLAARSGERWLRTVLQPVYSVRHRRAVGFEGLLRGSGRDGVDIPPWKLFATGSDDATLFLDRQAALLHAQNFFAICDPANWLFMNLHPVELMTGAWGDGFFDRLLSHSGVRPEQIVVEILEEPIGSNTDLVAAIRDFRAKGVLVAVDDFGAGHSNFERIWRLKPDIVKLDRSFIVQAEQNRALRRSLPSIVDILHQNGSLVVAEGIENETQALISLDADVDLVQGFHFARPFEISGSMPRNGVDWPALEGALNEQGATMISRQQMISPIARMYEAAKRLADGAAVEELAERVLQLDGVIRFYAIDEDGQQRRANIGATRAASQEDKRFAPLTNAEGATWRSRPYFRRARAHPGEVQISREYLSCTDSIMCVTLSIAAITADGQQVLCCDMVPR